MARYIGPSCRQCRREGMKLYLKGDRCYTDKCAITRRGKPPGQHGGRRIKLSNYGIQLREKQKVKRYYGVLETQFRNYYEKAEKMDGIVGENFLSLLERRLDNTVYRMGFATSRKEARQLVLHGHFTLNGHKANIPSILVNVGDEIVTTEKSKASPKFKELKERTLSTPSWVESDIENLKGRVASLPSREDVDLPIEEHLIVELYSR